MEKENLGSCLNMFPGERSVSSLLSNDPKRCVNKRLTHLSAAQVEGKECGKGALSAKYQRGVSRQANRSLKSDIEQLMEFFFFNSTNVGQTIQRGSLL